MPPKKKSHENRAGHKACIEKQVSERERYREICRRSVGQRRAMEDGVEIVKTSV